MNRTFHPECFVCAYCGKIFANSPFYLEDGLPYCEYGECGGSKVDFVVLVVVVGTVLFFLTDWNELFTTKCVSCGFPIEAGDRWVEALDNNYHSQCFNCTVRDLKDTRSFGFFKIVNLNKF